MAESRFPEHEKLKAISDKSQAIGEFVDWLGAVKGISLCELTQGRDRLDEYHPVRTSIRQLLAEYFDINEHRLDDEKRAMLDELRGQAQL